MAKKQKGAIAKAVDKMLHPHAEEVDQTSESEDQAAERGEEVEGFNPEDGEDQDQKQVSVEQGATSEGKHHHAKFDKFKKGNK